MNKNNQVNAQAVIVELQKEIADKALQIAMLKAQVTDLLKTKGKINDSTTSSEEVEGGNQ